MPMPPDTSTLYMELTRKLVRAGWKLTVRPGPDEERKFTASIAREGEMSMVVWYDQDDPCLAAIHAMTEALKDIE